MVFMGTPEFAVASLNAIMEQGYNVVGVVTSPDKPAGRGKKLSEPDVKKFALAKGLKVLQPINLKSPDFINEFHSLNANLGIVVAFRMLPEIVWAMPEFGTINLHASLLPEYRGAAPINHAIINGETVTGVTTFFLQHEIDTGHIIFQEKTPIYPGETAGELHDRLMNNGARLIVKTIRAIENNDYPQINQSTLKVPYKMIKPAPKIFKEDCRISWNESPSRINNLIRGLSPYPGAFGYFINTTGEQIQVKIFRATPENVQHNHHPGEIEIVGKDKLLVWVKGGKIKIDELQLEGKKRLHTMDFLNGFHLTENWKLS